ncbi:DUF2461 domain-containing protein [Actinosynnema pretiosum subsp. pretiosum]|uniref:TIGR02453 family protein n=2 Tax=Actinosynnema TaxID=40566 RepID=C6WCB6_ACTMD|nr:DUF2461 domain-containing protein [Actinosynnema mirum]ACU39504.1 conserved hypothetical protein [Actinosynnema mirum DSM 43827]QUF03132.1 DUF2461 domain-containing protein [Actinosynnema pretiosum subsp. pretiosum]
MEFRGFGEYAIDFFDGLVADNSKAYWEANKHTYHSDVRDPMRALLADLEAEFGAGKVFRPHRDVRFSKDKTPYKTHCGGVVESGRGGGAYYVQISPEGLMVGGGSFAMASDQLARYRESAADERRGEELRTVLDKLVAGGWEIRGNRLKRAPRGADPEHPRLELLKHRSIYAGKVWGPDDVLHEPECFDRVLGAWRELVAFNEWCADHVGVTEVGFRR